MPRFIDMTGRVFERLTVIALSHMSQQGAHWRCLCECGQEIIASRGNLSTGNTTSCGCRSREVSGARFRTHGLRSSPEYDAWAGLFQRCRNPKNKAYPNYGGRGIDVCKRWESYPDFLADMGPRPSPRHTIDRIDNDGHYEPSNCRWATMAEQGRNTRRNRTVNTPEGPMLLCDAALRAGVSTKTMWKRADRGWAPEQLFLPAGTYTKTRQGNSINQPESQQ